MATDCCCLDWCDYAVMSSRDDGSGLYLYWRPFVYYS